MHLNVRLSIKSALILAALFFVGCRHKDAIPTTVVQEEQPEAELLVKYSDEPNLAPASDRDYKRMTRQRMEDESALNAGAGSLWQMEGQTSYLFAQNKHREKGDRTQIKMEGATLKQLEMKVAAITDLLGELEQQKKAAEEQEQKENQKKLRLADIEAEKNKIYSNGELKDKSPEEIQKTAEERVDKRMPAAVDPKAKVAGADKTKKDEKTDLKEVELIPSKIVEKMPDGLYRISGQQFLTIKNRPYKVITTGLVRPEDYSDEFVSSTKIYDPQVEVIHIKKTEKF